ncbi:Asp/Glu racemase [Microdochium trichocladiopsis]|uniref:Asp/Glu racemase n=1 Tax=Microdochium trichocladiopsis TaxID=1682393 RepID=A0A9P9BG52_9PEZI|nr:Asp/Glu racemase [Microdochium trichocladiopsis]KAH7014309.1 Asp/Glu racemase [Microdochium trichocladiopsis]
MLLWSRRTGGDQPDLTITVPIAVSPTRPTKSTNLLNTPPLQLLLDPQGPRTKDQHINPPKNNSTTATKKSAKMRTLGLLGGMTYHATAEYYKTINARVQERLGGNASAVLVMHSVNYADMIGHFRAGNHAECSRQLCVAGRNLASIGADAIVLCVNTSHMWADAIEQAAGVPLLHIIDFTAEEIKRKQLPQPQPQEPQGKKTVVALLGTSATLEGDFIKGRLRDRHGLEVLVPPAEGGLRERMDAAIFGDLPRHVVTEECRAMFIDAAKDLVGQGARGVILGCTELMMVIKPGDLGEDVFLYDTVELHAKGVADWAVEEDKPAA